ncbi:uncharacterized protein LOC6726673 [Drosophila simulans]|uniref:GD19719 n=2 Tax=melanogaster subgroup TaxID=32351 RepID=B4QV06_DROSI|nr:uncharacterized protein LOC6726673 [Drosophila simulans]XP_016033167.1 uncharacterized protein LOC6726673 [Drosophila simulans]XP_033164053.1 uncharacterized protein LOC117143453 [Drosophila mauritiana]XP_033164054.1 uncharacterized protein LOC117143453 [Drosophila mauritiana]EDX11587.1 GD19719 [Drosophila simulans]KMZ01421.1 uncharacterized protein Dsimw501_GD19719, isoform A [Drosophila simulans]KMZ01422.1 uncharacterized protein Dsimw501_GD19719, isoform B [Drosophila simulans]
MSLHTRALVFSTFFGSCLAIGLLLVSMTTNHWVRATPRRKNSADAKGEFNFGLFFGNYHLNPGFGIRTNSVDVYTFVRTENDDTSFWLWLLTTLGTGFGLLACAVAAIAAVLKSASAAKRGGTMMLLLTSNICAAGAQIVAFVAWLVQFYQYFIHNVLLTEQQQQHWYSNGLAYLGYSFYLVVVSTIVVLLNIAILLYAQRRDLRNRQWLEAPSDDKNKAAIMLY